MRPAPHPLVNAGPLATRVPAASWRGRADDRRHRAETAAAIELDRPRLGGDAGGQADVGLDPDGNVSGRLAAMQ
jgi:hypothetical protein